MENDIKLTIIIPAFNEASRISNTLIETDKYLRQQSYRSEIIVVDDACTDTTIDVVKSLFYKIPNLRVVKHRTNQGKGGAVQTGVNAARGQWLLFMDADLATPINQLDEFWSYTNNFEVLIGSRHLQADSIKTYQPFLRHMFGRLANLYIRSLLLPGIMDPQCGFKLFSRSAAYDLFSRQTIKGFSFDIEILSLAAVLDYPIKEIPVNWYDKPNGTVNVARDGWRSFWDVLKIKARISQSLLHKSAYTQKV